MSSFLSPYRELFSRTFHTQIDIEERQAEQTGINRGTITRLYHETASRIELDVIEKLCVFFECQVGELFEYRKD